jgi:hypothetical protein
MNNEYRNDTALNVAAGRQRLFHSLLRDAFPQPRLGLAEGRLLTTGSRLALRLG